MQQPVAPPIRAAQWSSIAIVASFLAGIVPWPAWSQVPPAPADIVAAKAYGALERSCARCHQAGRLGDRSPGAGIANVLALDEVSRDPALVRPGVPDASRLYNIALTRERHSDAFNDPAMPEPSPLEVQALRDWIAELPAHKSSGRCEGREAVPAAHVSALIDKALAGLEPERTRQTRFLSLVHHYNSCLPDAELEALRGAIASLVSSVKRAEGTVGGGEPVAIDVRRLVYSVSLTALGWRGSSWDELVASYPLRARAAASTPTAISRATGTANPIVPADWLAHVLLSDTGESTPRRDPWLWGLGAPEALALAWRRPADLARVIAELGLLQDADLTRLPGYESARETLAARQLLAGATARRDNLDRLYLMLAGRPPEPLADVHGPAPLEIALSSDKPSYKAGDTASFTVIATRDCYLTLIGVDRAGRATVLFPSELATDHRITAGRPMRIPADGASYRFRFKEKGRETIVGVCSETHKAPEGIHHDYDRLRFTVLGDWQLFLREPPLMKEARRDDAATDIPRPNVRQNRRGRAGDAKAVAGPQGPDIQSRTAITIEIE